MSSVSIDHLELFNMKEMISALREFMIERTPSGFLGPSGAGKTTTLYNIASSIKPQELAEHPMNLDSPDGSIVIDRVVPMLVPVSVYDAYTFRGIIVPGATTVDPETGKSSTQSSLTTPIWYTDLMQLLTQNPTAHIVVAFDEFNTGDDEFQSVLLQLLSEGRVGPHVIPLADRERVSYTFLGNRPEDLPSSFTLIGPLAKRVWWYQVKPTANEVLEFMDAEGTTSPEVHYFLKQHPQALFVEGLREDGGCSELNQSVDEDSGNITPAANGVNPRRWGQISKRLVRMRKQGLSTSQKLKILSGAVPKPIALELVVAMDLVDEFATLDEIVADPENANVPTGALNQSMQVRNMMSQIDIDSVDQFITYVKRFGQTACSSVVAYQAARDTATTSGTMVSRGANTGLTATVRNKLNRAFLADYTIGMGSSMGLDTQHTSRKLPAAPVAPSAVPAQAQPLPTSPVAPMPGSNVVPMQPAVPTAPVMPAAGPVATSGHIPSAPAPAAQPSSSDDELTW